MVPATRRTSPLRTLLPVVLVSVVAAACTDTATSPAAPTDSPIPRLADRATADLAVSRRDPCQELAPEQIARTFETASGDDPEPSTTWQPGDRLPDTKEIADEYGCRIVIGEHTASAWVFAPPVTRAAARGLVERTTRDGCRSGAGDRFGQPGVAWTCNDREEPRAGVSGLVGDTWVVCQVEGPEAAQLADPWCAQVLGSLGS